MSALVARLSYTLRPVYPPKHQRDEWDRWSAKERQRPMRPPLREGENGATPTSRKNTLAVNAMHCAWPGCQVPAVIGILQPGVSARRIMGRAESCECTCRSDQKDGKPRGGTDVPLRCHLVCTTCRIQLSCILTHPTVRATMRTLDALWKSMSRRESRESEGVTPTSGMRATTG